MNYTVKGKNGLGLEYPVKSIEDLGYLGLQQEVIVKMAYDPNIE
jgi:hypothetical protein